MLQSKPDKPPTIPFNTHHWLVIDIWLGGPPPNTGVLLGHAVAAFDMETLAASYKA